FRAPDAGAQALQLNNLTVVDKEVDFRAIVLDVPGEYAWVSSFEHDFFQAQGVDNPRHHIGPPLPDILRDAFRLDHDHGGPGFQEAFGLQDEPARVTRPFGF